MGFVVNLEAVFDCHKSCIEFSGTSSGEAWSGHPASDQWDEKVGVKLSGKIEVIPGLLRR